jgi:TM2 domain-containing membrane protein YozV
MNKRLLPVFIFLTGALFLSSGAEESSVSGNDSSVQKPAVAKGQAPETATGGEIVLKPKITTYDYDAMPKDPLASTFFSATLPGTGQLYNKEYLRGICTGVVFYGSVLAIQYFINKWEQINTDTFFIQEAYNADVVHPVYVPKPDSLQVGLPTSDKIFLVSTIVLAAGSYIFGIFDSYNGANRYNRKLMEAQKIKLGFSADPLEGKIAVCARYRF